MLFATNEFNLQSQAFRENGFTLLEVIIIIVLVGTFMAACGMPFLAGIRKSELPEIVTVANQLVIEKIEELSGGYYCFPADEARAQVSGFTDYEREVSVTEVNATDLSTPEAGSGYSKITVSVYHSDKLPAGISLVTLRTDF
jgi:type II secretory pathway pseudopilin PulG